MAGINAAFRAAGFFLFTAERPVWRAYDAQTGREMGHVNTLTGAAATTGADGFTNCPEWRDFLRLLNVRRAKLRDAGKLPPRSK